MALKKQIELDNGVIVNYHRIVSIKKITNQQNIIEIASYINEAKREKEKQCLDKKEVNNVFINTQYINSEYDETSTIENTYEYLKTLDKFKDAKDC